MGIEAIDFWSVVGVSVDRMSLICCSQAGTNMADKRLFLGAPFEY